MILCAGQVIRNVLAFWSASFPVRVYIAEDGYHANRLLRTVPCRLLVTDRLLPPWPGLDTFHTLRTRHPRLRIAFVYDGSLEARTFAGRTGATDFLSTPLTRHAVMDVIGPAQRDFLSA